MRQLTPINYGRPINRIVVHCTASSLTATVDAIKKYWREQLGWKNFGYHILIDHTGMRHYLAPFNQVVNGVRGHNWDSVHVCTVGGRDSDDRTDAQKKELAHTLRGMRLPSALGKLPIVGHRDLSPDRNGDGVITPDEWTKMCPHYDIKEWCRSVGIDPD